MYSIRVRIPIIIFFSLAFCKIDCSFESAWRQMQSEYANVKKISKRSTGVNYVNNFYDRLILSLDKLVAGQPNRNFLKASCLTGIMVRSYVESSVVYEETFLKYCMNANTKSKLEKFSDESGGLLDKNCKLFNCSITTLGHLFYVAKVLETYENGSEPSTIIELGGGFGNLARCFKQILPDSTVVIIDLPEMSVIQKMYLNYTLPNVETILHQSSDDLLIKKGAINLVPLYLMEKLDVGAEVDLFISTFALSESPKITQEFVSNINFFNAKKVYITGQISGWKGLGFDWIEDHGLILGSVRKKYNQISCTPFHLFKPDFLSYEILGQQ